ncbi:hypothetical protein TNIN_170421 [Trichonephila inaurata madagascariensis]|uniref:Uncharacterized protein n=1 Tax=Trichonephila inaurata madagascariensis TaxID=2747483 RepID=A0A8X7C6U9_9ARAC|nr:hypothetical protein TNIN_170421 [Trichonephila inaurata madagascariensis]
MELLNHLLRGTQAVKIHETNNNKTSQEFSWLNRLFPQIYQGRYSTIAKPLSDLTRKRKILCFWDSTKAAFENLKNNIMSKAHSCIYKYGRRTGNCILTLVSKDTAQFLLQKPKMESSSPVLLHVEKDKYSRRKYDS